MKQMIMLCVLLTTMVLASCTTTYVSQDSSKEEALYMVQRDPDYQRTVFHLNVKVLKDDRPGVTQYYPVAYQSNLNDSLRTAFAHLILVQKKDGSFCVELLNDERPPKVVFSELINLEQTYSYHDSIKAESSVWVP